MQSPRPDVERLAEAFETAWQGEAEPRLEDFVPPAANPERQAALAELIAIDLDHRWRTGRVARAAADNGGFQRPRLEDYLRRFPDLGPLERLPPELIADEYRVRHCWGDRPAQAEYRARFPSHWPQLEQALSHVDAELTAEFTREPAGAATRQPPEHSPTFPRSERATASTIPVARPVDGPVTVSDLLDTLRATQLITLAQLNELILADLQGRFPEPDAVAAELRQRAWLTPYQLERLLEGHGHDLVLGPHLLLERLGEGGGGQVYKARHRKMNRIEALKVIRPELLTDPEMLRRAVRCCTIPTLPKTPFKPEPGRAASCRPVPFF